MLKNTSLKSQLILQENDLLAQITVGQGLKMSPRQAGPF